MHHLTPASRRHESSRAWSRRRLPGLLAWLLLAGLAPHAIAQELTPRNWSHLPVDTNFLGGGYAYTEGDISFDPVLRIENATMQLHTWVMKYIRTFELLDRTARVGLATGYQEGRWSGLLDGAPASATRKGLTDSVVRFAVNLYGAPPLNGKDYAAYRAATTNETIVGAALALHLPTGDYQKDKLINLGRNRYTLRPQLGVVHTRDRWTFEVTGGIWFTTENDSFFNGNTLEQDPLYAFQGHLIYTFRPGLWTSASVGTGIGARSEVNGVKKNDRKENIAYALAFGYPLSRRLGIKVSYLGIRSKPRIGTETDTLIVALTTFW